MNNGAEVIAGMAQLEIQLFELRRKTKNYPRKLQEARKQLNAEEGLLKEIEGPWSELEHQIKEKEATIKVALDTIEKFEAHIKRVNTQKEYVAANKQVDEARRLNEQLQNEILENRVKQEELEPSLKESRERHKNVLGSFQETEETILKEQSKVKKQSAKLEAQLKEILGSVGGQFWDYYQRLVKGGKQPAIVQAVAGACGGCNMTVPPQSYNLMIANPAEIHTCAHCARIVYYAPSESEAEEVEAADTADTESTVPEVASA
jgi:predicted  nucleic acid-binding Zn-ribbon protein